MRRSLSADEAGREEEKAAAGSLAIAALHERHPGVSVEVSAFYAAAAAICLHRHHRSPKDVAVAEDGGAVATYETAWDDPSTDQARAYANDEDTTENGAYCVALAAADAHLSLLALRRSQSRSGADYYLIPDGSAIADDYELDLERADLVRLEVSGIDEDTESTLRARLRRKLDQAVRAPSDVPAVAAVVGFRTARVAFARQK